jgi:hypothetical protein
MLEAGQVGCSAKEKWVRWLAPYDDRLQKSALRLFQWVRSGFNGHALQNQRNFEVKSLVNLRLAPVSTTLK